MALEVTPVNRNLQTRVTFLALEFEDLFVVLALAAVMNVVGHFVRGDIGGLPLSFVVQYGVPLSAVPLLMAFKYGRPRGYPDIIQLKARDLLVKNRTRLMNAVRGVLKSAGLRVPNSGTSCFPSKAAACIPDELKLSLTPLLETISHLNKQIYSLDKAIETTAQNRYPETNRLRQISGVGSITALQYVLTIGDPGRFAHSRDVPTYLGLRPRRHQSGSVEQQLRISKAGNKQLRSLLVQCAQYLLGRFGPDSDLKRWGTRMFERGGKNSKKRAIVAVARKLAVLLHRLWVTGDTYHPLYNVAASSVTP